LRQQAELLELAHDAIIVRDREGEILYWNKGAEDLYGWRRDDVIGKFINDILTARKPPEESYGILGERGYWAGRVYHRTKDGREIAVDSRHVLVPRADGTKVILEANHEIMAAVPAEIT
jgi:PAS domain S-box-containing protein